MGTSDLKSRYGIYDPLVDKSIPVNHDNSVQSYWNAHGPVVGSLPLAQGDNGELPAKVDAVVIGAGYTGLNAALELATRGQHVVVLEAGQQVAAGCSSRNAGFVLPASGRLSVAQYQQKFGQPTASAVLQEFNAGVQHVQALVDDHQISCDWTPSEYLRVAHSTKQAKLLQALADPNAAWPREFIDSQQIQHQHSGIRHAHGGLLQKPAASVHPKALALGIAQAAQNAGARIFTSNPVQGLTPASNGFEVSTPRGVVHGRKVLICSNGYLEKSALQGAVKQLNRCQLPALSSVLVTAPLTTWQREHLGLQPTRLIMDTRRLKYYYRLLADGRLLFGGRGSVQGADANHPNYRQALYQAMLYTLPVLRGLAVEFHWSGWVSVSADNMPRAQAIGPNLYAAFGYCGAGISFASLAGKRLAQITLGDQVPPLPFYHKPPQAFPFAPWRRLGQRAYYQYARLRDLLD